MKKKDSNNTPARKNTGANKTERFIKADPGKKSRFNPVDSSKQERPARTASVRKASSPGKEERPARTAFGPKGRGQEKRAKFTRDNSGQKRFSKADPGGKNLFPRGGEADIRLNRYIANSGVCSRREADKLIVSGQISVNGKVITTLGTKIGREDTVKFNGKSLEGEKKVYVLLNKPKDCVTTVDDPHAGMTVMDLVKGCCKERIYPVGRLDRNTTGVLLLTNDGALTKRLTHPSHKKKKIYQIGLDKSLALKDQQIILEGFELEDGFTQADDLQYIDPLDKKLVGLEIHSGRNRIVRRMFEHLGYKVKKLDRVYFAGLTKKGLQRGRWRFLTDNEIAGLKMNAFK